MNTIIFTSTVEPELTDPLNSNPRGSLHLNRVITVLLYCIKMAIVKKSGAVFEEDGINQSC